MKSFKVLSSLYAGSLICLFLSYCMVFAILNDRGVGAVNHRQLFMYPTLLISSVIGISSTIMICISFFQKKKWPIKVSWVLLILISICTVSGVLYFKRHYASPYNKEICLRKIRNIGGVWREYSFYTSNWPDPNTWCDVLYEYEKLSDHNIGHYFICPGAEEGRCNYAINSKVTRYSSDDVVWVFDSYVGWNLNGGKELLNPDNHEEKGCNILFCGGKIKFVETDKFDDLKWE